jgi:hypothetical protein
VHLWIEGGRVLERACGRKSLRAGDGTGGVSGHVSRLYWGESSMDDEKRWQDMDSEEQAKRITELEHRIETLEAKIKAMETQETAKGLLTDTGAIG